jgi:hypothetical protein
VAGAQADFVIDLIGATGPIDLGTAGLAGAAAALAGYRTPWTAA